MNTSGLTSPTLSIAADSDMVGKFQDLVCAEYGKRGWLKDQTPTRTSVCDKFDAQSNCLIVRSESDIIAGMRIVRHSDFGFPHESEIGLNQTLSLQQIPDAIRKLIAETPQSNIAEITRVVGKKTTRRMLTLDIVKCLYWFSKNSNIVFYVMVIDVEFFTLCTTIGVPIVPIGIPIECEGSWTIPAITIPKNYEASISKVSPGGWSYIQNPSNLDDTWELVH